MKKTNVKMNKPIYLGMSISDISKTLVCEFWHDYVRPKYGDRAKICYTDTDGFVIYIITEDFFEDIVDDVRINLTFMKMIKDLFQQVRIIRRKDYYRSCWTQSKNMVIIMDDGSEH